MIVELFFAPTYKTLEGTGIYAIAAFLLVFALVVSYVSLPVVYFNYRGTEPPRGRLDHPFDYIEGFYGMTAIASVVTGLVAFLYWTLYVLGWRDGGLDELPLVDFNYTFGSALIIAGVTLFLLADRTFPRKQKTRIKKSPTEVNR